MDVHAMESSQYKLDIVMKHKRNFNPKMKKLISFINIKINKEIEDIFMNCKYDY